MQRTLRCIVFWPPMVPVQERRAQRTHPEYKKPELMATAPNQVWSWDITQLLGPKKKRHASRHPLEPLASARRRTTRGLR